MLFHKFHILYKLSTPFTTFHPLDMNMTERSCNIWGEGGSSKCSLSNQITGLRSRAACGGASASTSASPSSSPSSARWRPATSTATLAPPRSSAATTTAPPIRSGSRRRSGGWTARCWRWPRCTACARCPSTSATSRWPTPAPPWPRTRPPCWRCCTTSCCSSSPRWRRCCCCVCARWVGLLYNRARLYRSLCFMCWSCIPSPVHQGATPLVV